MFIITTIAGYGTGTYSGDNGQATAATLHSPFGVSVDTSGDELYILLLTLLELVNCIQFLPR